MQEFIWETSAHLRAEGVLYDQREVEEEERWRRATLPAMIPSICSRAAASMSLASDIIFAPLEEKSSVQRLHAHIMNTLNLKHGFEDVIRENLSQMRYNERSATNENNKFDNKITKSRNVWTLCQALYCQRTQANTNFR